MIKYTKEIKAYKSNFKNIHLGLLKYRTILVKYKSYIILSSLVAVASFVLGHTIAYNKDLTWVYANKNNTEELISNFQKTYDIQQKLNSNSEQAFNELLDCFSKGKDNCKIEELINNNRQLVSERDSLLNELDKLNSEASGIMAKFSLK